MAIKNRVLKKLNTLDKYVLLVMETGSKKALRDFYRELNTVRNLCREGLSESSYADYGEFYDGLILATEQMQKVTRPQEDVLILCKELLQHLIIKTDNERHFKKEIVFLPYKVSMWDSLESIWMAASADKKNCNAYVMPIPYCDRNPDGTPAKWHYERELMPSYVPTIDCQRVDLEAWHPDVIFIHNPYDNQNYVTSIDGRFFADKLRQYTDLLVYSPYYVTSGGMGEGQGNCPIFRYVDYIIVQSKGLCRFFDASVPMKKLVPLGSPKLDRVIRLCKNPPDPPEEWKEKLRGKKVYFYNTSLNGLLSDTNAFLNKMQYVFRCFAGRKDACLIWRPHPLMEATLNSMRKGDAPCYEHFKEMFIDEGIGIYDDTPDIENTIALSDVYVGDSGTSVTMLFAISGKPLFILNNNIHELPSSDDWRGELLTEVTFQGDADWLVTPTNHLYHRQPGKGYTYVTSLCEYNAASYYMKAVNVEGRVYVCPANAQDILIVSERGIEERISLDRRIEVPGAFVQAWQSGHYIFLVPFKYPAIVRFDTRTKQVEYLEGLNHIFVKQIDGEWMVGGSCIWNGALLIASPDTSELIHIDTETLESEVGQIGAGTAIMAPDGDDIWFISTKGYSVFRWQPLAGKVNEYFVRPEGFQPHHYIYRFETDLFPYGMPAFDDNFVYIPPLWGNQFVKLNKSTGIAEEWKTPVQVTTTGRNGYFGPSAVAGFTGCVENGHWRLFYWPERKLYDVDLKEGAFEEVGIDFNEDALSHEAVGFVEQSDWMRYGCQENYHHTLPALIEGKLPGEKHDRDRQLRVFREVAANNDGTSGEKIYSFTMEKLREKGMVK